MRDDTFADTYIIAVIFAMAKIPFAISPRLTGETLFWPVLGAIPRDECSSFIAPAT
jgi:hypothetical protein